MSEFQSKDSTYAKRSLISDPERYEPFTKSLEYRMLAAEYPNLVSDYPAAASLTPVDFNA